MNLIPLRNIFPAAGFTHLLCRSVVAPKLRPLIYRPLSEKSCWSKKQALTPEQALIDVILKAPWHDPGYMMMNLGLMEASFNKIRRARGDHSMLARTFDCMCRSADIRDHIAELLEQCSRSSGILGVGLFAAEKIDNLEEHALHVENEYQKLLEEFKSTVPLAAKIRECVGSGLAQLRQRVRFDFKEQHYRFF